MKKNINIFLAPDVCPGAPCFLPHSHIAVGLARLIGGRVVGQELEGQSQILCKVHFGCE